MSKIITASNIDDFYVHKFLALGKMDKIIDFIEEKNNGAMIKTASAETESIINLFASMLSCLNLKISGNDLKGVIDNFSKPSSPINNLSEKIGNAEQSIYATSKSIMGSRKDDIKIVSKTIRDSHYQIDISKDTIVKKGKRVSMVSCYCRDTYLGRYLIKRNYYFSNERSAASDSTYDEILNKMGAIKDRYYEGIIDVPTVTAQMKTVLDGVISEIKFEEDDISIGK